MREIKINFFEKKLKEKLKIDLVKVFLSIKENEIHVLKGE